MNDQVQAVKQGGGAMNVLGIMTMILGLLAISAPLVATTWVAFLIGAFVLAAGFTRLFWAFKAGSFGSGLLMFAIGGLTIVCGGIMLANPLFTVSVLTMLLAAYFVVDGLTEIFAAFQVKPAQGWGWLLFGGIVSLALGIMIWRQFPLSGIWAIGVLLGVKLLFAGMMMITVGTTARSMAKQAEAETQQPS